MGVALSMVSFPMPCPAGGMPRPLAVRAVAALVGLTPLGFVARRAFRA